MLILKLLTGCLAAFFSIHPIAVLCASDEWFVLHLLEQPFTSTIAKSIKLVLGKSLNQTEAYLRVAIRVNNSEAARCIIEHASQSSTFKKLIRMIYKRRLYSVANDQVIERNSATIASLVSKETISAIDLGYLIGLEELIKLLIEWKLTLSEYRIESIKGNEQQIKSALLEQNLDVSAKNKYGENLFHTAFRLYKSKIVKFLIAHDKQLRTKATESIPLGQEVCVNDSSNDILDINSRNNDGNTSLHYACMFMFESLKHIKLLLEISEIDINVQNKYGTTPILAASFRGNWHFVDYLFTREDLKVNAKGPCGDTLLHVACRNGRLETVKRLLANHKLVNVNIRNEWEKTPLMEAAGSEEWKVIKHLLNRQDLYVNEKDDYGNTLLHIACRKGELKIVRQLLGDFRVFKAIKNQHGQTPRMIATIDGFKDILQLFDNHMND